VFLDAPGFQDYHSSTCCFDDRKIVLRKKGLRGETAPPQP
jgi:hypothetical protein